MVSIGEALSKAEELGKRYSATGSSIYRAKRYYGSSTSLSEWNEQATGKAGTINNIREWFSTPESDQTARNDYGSDDNSGSTNPLPITDIPGVPDDLPDDPDDFLDEAPDNPLAGGNNNVEPDPVESDPVTDPIPDPTDLIPGIPTGGSSSGSGSSNSGSSGDSEPEPNPEPAQPSPFNPVLNIPGVDSDKVRDAFDGFKNGVMGGDEVSSSFRNIAQGNIDEELKNRLGDVQDIVNDDWGSGFNPQDIIPELPEFSGGQLFPELPESVEFDTGLGQASENLEDIVKILVCGGIGAAFLYVVSQKLGGEK